MVESLQHLWRALESVPDLAGVLAEWRSVLGPEYERVQRFLLPTDRLARSIKSTVPGRACVHEIRRHKGEYLAVCPDGCDTMVLAKADIAVHRLNLPTLCREIAEALGMEAATPEDLPHVPKTMNIGVYVPYGDRCFRVCFAAVGEPADMRRAVDALASVGKPYILLAPTRSALTQACTDKVTRSKSCFLAMADVLGLDDHDQFALLDGQAADCLLAEFRDANLPKADGTDGQLVFPTPSRAQWDEVAILFKDAHTVSASVGDVQRVLNYTEMGMANRKNGNPTKQWDLLYQFATGNGRITWQNRGPSPKHRKQKELLADALRRFFQIESDPFILAAAGGWNARFIVTMQGDSL